MRCRSCQQAGAAGPCRGWGMKDVEIMMLRCVIFHSFISLSLIVTQLRLKPSTDAWFWEFGARLSYGPPLHTHSLPAPHHSFTLYQASQFRARAAHAGVACTIQEPSPCARFSLLGAKACPSPHALTRYWPLTVS